VGNNVDIVAMRTFRFDLINVFVEDWRQRDNVCPFHASFWKKIMASLLKPSYPDSQYA